MRGRINSVVTSAHIPNANPSTAHTSGERPRRAAIVAVRGASDASMMSEVAIISPAPP